MIYKINGKLSSGHEYTMKKKKLEDLGIDYEESEAKLGTEMIQKELIFTKEEKVDDLVNSPSHYNQGNIETIDKILDTVEDPSSYLLGNIIKYISRYKHKNGIQDLDKAEWYLKKLREVEYGNE